MTTLKDIAHDAKVSVSTVSRVLNGQPVCSLISLKRIEFQYNGLPLFPQLHEFHLQK